MRRLLLATLVAGALAAAGAASAGTGDSPSGKLVFSSSHGLVAANADGSGRRLLGPGSDPAWSPDGQRIAFIRENEQYEDLLYVMDSDGRNVRRLSTVEAAAPIWSPDGTLIAFDAADGVMLVPSAGGSVVEIPGEGFGAGITWAPESRRLAVGGDEKIVISDTSGRVVGEIQLPGLSPRGLAWSPDGQRIAFLDEEGDDDVYVVDAGGGDPSFVARGACCFERPAWAPDSSRFVFTSGDDVWIANADGSGARQLTATVAGERSFSPGWSPDGAWLAYSRERYRNASNSDVFLMRPDGQARYALTQAFPDGGSYVAGPLGGLTSWAAGQVEGASPWPIPRTFRLALSRSHMVPDVVDELAADGWRAAVIARSGLRAWNARLGGGRRIRTCDLDFGYSYLQEPAIAGSATAVVCYRESTSFWEYEVFVSTAAHRHARGIEYADPLFDSLNLQGDRELLVYNDGRVVRGGVRNAKLWRIVGTERSLILAGPRSRPVVAVDRGRIVIRQPGPAVDIRDALGRMLHRVEIGRGPVAGVELTGERLVVLRRGRLLVFDVPSGELVRSFPLRPGGLARPRLRDAEGNFAVYVAGIALHVVRLTDGRDLALRIERQADPSDVQIEPQGLFYAYNEAYAERPGRIVFVPMAQLQRRFAAAAASQ